MDISPHPHRGSISAATSPASGQAVQPRFSCWDEQQNKVQQQIQSPPGPDPNDYQASTGAEGWLDGQGHPPNPSHPKLEGQLSCPWPGYAGEPPELTTDRAAPEGRDLVQARTQENWPAAAPTNERPQVCRKCSPSGRHCVWHTLRAGTAAHKGADRDEDGGPWGSAEAELAFRTK